MARDCRVGEGSTSSGLNSGSSANRSSKSTSDRTLLGGQQGHLFYPCRQLPLLPPALGTPPSAQPPAPAHLSTESKVFFRGGGRTFSFLPELVTSLRSGVSPAALPLVPSLLPLLLPLGPVAGAGLGGVGGSPRLSRPSPGTRQSADELGNLLA